MTDPIEPPEDSDARHAEDMQKLGDRMVESNRLVGEQITQAGKTASRQAESAALRQDGIQALASTAAENAAIVTAKATESIRKLTIITVIIGTTTLTYILVFSVLFWKYAIILRAP